mgnify:CR=1 FL=1
MKSLNYIAALLLVFLSSLVYADVDPDPYTKYIELNGIEQKISVVGSEYGTDIIVSNRRRMMNISSAFPGDNLFPQVFEGKNRFYVSWIHSDGESRELCLYDSLKGESRKLIADAFKFIGNPKAVYQHGRLRGLAFIGLETTAKKDDLYLFDLKEGAVRNISNTEDFEKKFELFSEESALLLKSETKYNRYIYKLDRDLFRFDSLLAS